MDILDLRDKKTVKEEKDLLSMSKSSTPSSFKKLGNFIWEVVKVIVISLAIIVPIRMFVIQPFIVEGASMVPNFYDGEYLIVDEISYRFKEPQRGDVVIFHPPQNPKTYYIKRIIGLPGETVELKKGSIYIYNSEYSNGIKLDEIDYEIESHLSPNEQDKVTLGHNEYYLIGDNRKNSLDSRRFGGVNIDYIRGKAWLRAFPFTRFTVFEAPKYNF